MGGLLLRREGGGDPGDPSVLAPSDIEFLGYVRLATSGIANDITSSPMSFALRYVGGTTLSHLRVYMVGHQADDSPIHEYDFGGVTPNLTLASAPTLTRLRTLTGTAGAQGKVRMGTDAGTEDGNEVLYGALKWDEAREGFWQTYGNTYVPPSPGGNPHPNLVFLKLNDGTGEITAYGPWRFGISHGYARAGIIDVPQDFADEFLDGKTLACYGKQNSGVAQHPFGPSLSAFSLDGFDPLTAPADSVSDSDVTIPVHILIANDQASPRPRNDRVRECGWVDNTPYDCREGTYINPGNGFWGGSDPGNGGENDTIYCEAWVRTATKEGLFCIGQMANTPSTWTPEDGAPGDPDGIVHTWYGQFTHATASGSGPEYVDGECCHGQSDPKWQGTGPGTYFRQRVGFIFSREQLGAAADGDIEADEVYPAVHEAVDMQAISADFADRVVFGGMFGPQAHFDEHSEWVFTAIRLEDGNHTGHSHPVLAIFGIAE